MKQEDLAVFEEYFQLPYAIPVNFQIGGDISTLPSFDEFEQSIPIAYKIASEMQGLEQNMLRPLRQLGDVIEPLADYLKAQSRKIDLMMSYVLQGQDDGDLKLSTTSFGGGGFTFESDMVLDIDTWLQCKLFFNDDAAAVFCLAKIANIEPVEDKFKYTLIYSRIRDEDQEIIVRASLHQQSKQLLKKTQNKQKKNAD